MAAKCSGIPGAVCSNNVPFRVHKDAIETDTGRIDCDLSAALGELGTVLPADAQVTRTLADLEIFSLCDDCWTKLDAKWGKGVYMPIPARAIVDGMFFHTSMADYKGAGDGLNMTKIKSTVVHEMIHWTVAPTTSGFQNTGETGHGIDATKWDECMTDYLALTTYKKLNWGDYETGYNNLSQFIDVGIGLLKATPGFKKAAVTDTLKKCFPEVAAETDFTKLVEGIRKPLFEKLALRYVKDNAKQKVPTDPVGFVDFMKAIFPTNLGGKLGGYGAKVF